MQDVRNPTTAMMVLLRELELETDLELGGEGSAMPGKTTPPLHPLITESKMFCLNQT